MLFALLISLALAASQVKAVVPSAPSTRSITVTPGEPFMMPFRSNNPHPSEIEFNIWISNRSIIVPIKKPVCAFGGLQGLEFWATVPQDFNTLIGRVPSFTGCNKPTDCVLQFHSATLEPRTYSFGTPIVITNTDGTTGANLGPIEIQPPAQGVGLHLDDPSRPCLSINDPAANIQTAKPFQPHLASNFPIQ
ncbi:hypothetical protein HDV05_001712 [Chytridiales sp. JEL 0842]|nr:hypothetical protein HDV05_001712 [Chytridiales sp. JEL 0842]